MPVDQVLPFSNFDAAGTWRGRGGSEPEKVAFGTRGRDMFVGYIPLPFQLTRFDTSKETHDRSSKQHKTDTWKRHWPATVISLFFLRAVLWLPTFVSSAQLNPAKVHVVDVFTPPGASYPNFLFRGDVPRNDSVSFTECGSSFPYWMCFGWTELIPTMTTVARSETRHSFPPSFVIADYSFLYDRVIDEMRDLMIEDDFFLKYPARGYLVNWNIFQTLSDWPADHDPATRESLARSFPIWDVDKLDDLVQTLYSLLHTANSSSSSVSTVIYAHCEQGVDRTGEVGMAYQMRYLNWTYPEAMVYAESVGNRSIAPSNECEVRWYCLYLMFELGLTHLYCPDAPP
jgi:hypothetical protein